MCWVSIFPGVGLVCDLLAPPPLSAREVLPPTEEEFFFLALT